MFVKWLLALSCLYIWAVYPSPQGLYSFSFSFFCFVRLFSFFLFFLFFFFLGSEHASVCVCTYMCNWAKTILKGDIRDGWITENLLKRDNPSCTLIRHTPWFSNGIFSIISAVTVIPSSYSAQLNSALHHSSFSPSSFFFLSLSLSPHSFSSSFPAYDFAQTASHSGCLGNVNRISNGLCISTIPCLGID